MSYQVELEVFQGPLDLLLQLVSRQRLDVAEVSVSSITDHYLKAVKKMGEVDLEVASGFLVLAATLLELKSLKLLPSRGADDPEVAALLEERDHLLHRLIEYSTFKGAAGAISTLMEVNRHYHSRIPEIPEELIPGNPDLLAGVAIEDIREAALRALAPSPQAAVDTSFMTPIRINVPEMVDILAEEVRTQGKSTFRDLCRQATARIEIVVRFLALLELFRVQSVELEQRGAFEEIVIRWREPGTRRTA